VIVTSPEDDDERRQWIESTAADLRAVLADPAIRADLSALLVGDGHELKRRRRLAELREDLAGFELTWQRKDGGS
jgi:hypothetical protein